MSAKVTKSILATLILFVSFSNPFEAQAKGAPLACQVEAAGGLAWEGSRWISTAFKEGKFILVLEDNKLQTESASKAMHLNAPTTCIEVSKKRISCQDQYGGYLLFDPITMQGTIARLSGGADNDSKERDTISVEAFACQSF